MKIIILGAGQVGGSLAQNLVKEASDITLVDTDADRLRGLQDRYDIRTVCGRASHPSVLRQAGAEDADMLIAVTNSDEVNMVACQVAYSVFHTPTKIARVRSREYLAGGGIFRDDAMPVDHIVNPEEILTHDIKRLVDNPGALQVMDFAGGQAKLVGLRIDRASPLANQAVSTIRSLVDGVDARVAAIFRRNSPMTPEGSTILQAKDEVFLIAAAPHIPKLMNALRQSERPNKRVVIAGGGHIGENLALQLEHRYGVRVIEQDRNRCFNLSESLESSIVLNGNASNRELLVEESIEDTDVFCAITNDDEANIMSSMLAKSLGAKRVITLINNPAYVDLIEGQDIDIAISPQLATLGTILTHIRRGDVVKVHSLRRGAAEAIEAIAHGDYQSSKVIGKTLGELSLPSGATVGALIRRNEVMIAHDNITVEADDHFVLFLVDKTTIRDVEALFQAPVSFF